jgi:hypothetical protein
MRIIFIVIIFSYSVAYSQITSTKSADAKLEKIVTSLDSSKNHFGKDVMQYLNRKVYLNHKAESLRKYGYDKIYDYLPEEEDYDEYDYDEVAGKYYNVIDVIPAKGTFSQSKYYLKMVQEKNGKIYYYQYDTNSDAFFNLILVDHFEWLKKKYIGTKIYSKGTNPFGNRDGAFDYATGKKVDFSAGTEWTIKDVTIEEKYFSLAFVIENNKNDKLLIETRWLDYPKWLLLEENYKYIQEKYPEYLESVLNKKLKIGMPKDIVILSWGKPEKINKSVYGNIIKEQWVYNNQYLYFEDGILTAAN